MAEVILKHNSNGSDSVRQDIINYGDTIIFKAEGAAFDITFDNPNQFSPSINSIHIDLQKPSKGLTPANDVTSILFNYKCSVCGNTVGRPAKIIIGVKPYEDQLDRIEKKLDVLLSKIENIEKKLNKFIK